MSSSIKKLYKRNQDRLTENKTEKKHFFWSRETKAWKVHFYYHSNRQKKTKKPEKTEKKRRKNWKKDSREKVKVADTYERVLKRNGKSRKSIKSRKLYSEKKEDMRNILKLIIQELSFRGLKNRNFKCLWSNWNNLFYIYRAIVTGE